MKKLLALVIITVIPYVSFCQEEEMEEKNFHFIEVGIGAALSDSYSDPLTLNFGMSNSLGRVMANFLDYNMAFDKSGVNRHEISFKMGPYYQFNRYSYMAISAGASIFINESDDNYTYRNGMTYYEENYQLNIPVQAKINAGLYKGFCMGVKATYNKMINTYYPDKASLMVYMAWGW